MRKPATIKLNSIFVDHVDFQSAAQELKSKQRAHHQSPTWWIIKREFNKRYWRVHRRANAILKRSLDITAAGLALLGLSPIIISTIIAIRLESPGNVFFKQERIGKNGNPFNMWKFRSMYIDAEERKQALMEQNEMSGGVLFKMKNDPRITRIGKFIRKFSIDELPQLWNVLCGDMSIVGPRPAIRSEVDQYNMLERQRLVAKPGITCIWQVSGRSDIPFEKQVELDRRYISETSMSTDIKLMLLTVPAVITAKGAY